MHDNTWLIWLVFAIVLVLFVMGIRSK